MIIFLILLDKYMADFRDSGWILVKDKDAINLTNTDGEGCAKACAEQIENCASFNYCPGKNGQAWDSYCELSSLSINTRNVQTYKNSVRNCRHYEKMNTIRTQNSLATAGGLTGGQFFGLLFGLFIVGLALGGAAYYGHDYYQRRNVAGGGGGFNFSVRFMRKDDHAKLQEEH